MQSELGFGQLGVEAVMPSNPEAKDYPRKCWQGRGGQGVAWGLRDGGHGEDEGW